MKFLLVLLVLLVAFWIWRNNRLGDGQADRTPPPQPRPTRMVACLQCGTHVPASESVAGRDGPYCCHEHRRQRQERT